MRVEMISGALLLGAACSVDKDQAAPVAEDPKPEAGPAPGDVNHAFLGLQPQPLTPEIARQLNVSSDSGVIALDVEDCGPAATAGVVPGDVIVSVEGRDVRSVEDLLAALRNHRPGERVQVALERDGNKQELAVTLGEQRA